MEPTQALLKGTHDLVAMAGPLLEQVEDDVLEVAALEDALASFPGSAPFPSKHCSLHTITIYRDVIISTPAVARHSLSAVRCGLEVVTPSCRHRDPAVTPSHDRS